MKVPVAYENPRNLQRFDSYRGAVTSAVRKMGSLTLSEAADVVQKDEPYMAAAFRAGVDAKTTAGIIFHKHLGQRVIAAEPAGASGASCPQLVVGPGVVGLPSEPPFATRLARAACPPPTEVPPVDAPSPCGPFTKVVRDEARYAACRARALPLGSLTTPKAIFSLIGPDLKNETQEVFVVLGLDVNGVLLCYDEVARGQVDHVAVSPSDVLGIVLLNRCKAFIVAHNHPSGDARPSKDDGALTAKLREACRPFGGLVMLDHLVIGHGEFYSFADKKLTKGAS